MKVIKVLSLALCSSILLGGCGASNTLKGGLIGGGSGVALGAIIGKIAGNTAIGAAVGTVVGTTAGILIGKKMDKAAAKAKEIEGAKVQEITDTNGLQAVKVTFDSGILFATNSSTLSPASKTSLTKFANLLKENPTMDITIYGYTDNTGSQEVNQRVSDARAQAVVSYLRQQGVPATQFQSVEGRYYLDPVTSNDTAEGRSQNRRVEIYMYASTQMIKDAEAQAR